MLRVRLFVIPVFCLDLEIVTKNTKSTDEFTRGEQQ